MSRIERRALSGGKKTVKLSENLRQDHESGDCGLMLEGYAERAEALEQAIADVVDAHRKLKSDNMLEGISGVVELDAAVRRAAALLFF